MFIKPIGYHFMVWRFYIIYVENCFVSRITLHRTDALWKESKPHVTGGFPSQRESNAESVSCHGVIMYLYQGTYFVLL